MAKGPGGSEVDRVSVRVVPDTSRFAQELRAALKKIEGKIRFTVPVDFDLSEVAKAAAKLRSELGKDIPVRIKVDQAAIRAAAAKLPGPDLNLGRTETAIGNALVLVGRLAERLKAARNRAVELAQATTRIAKRAVSVRQHWRDVGAKLDQAARGIRQIKADGFYRNMIRVSDGILGAGARLGRFGVLATRVLGKTTANAARAAGSAVSAVGSAAGRAVSSLGKLGRTGWIVVGVLGLAAPAVGLLSTLLLTLPALGLAAGAGIAAVALGMDGIKRAASQLKPEVAALKASLSATFEKGLTPVFAKLEKLFPVLDRGLNQVAGGVISMASEFTNVVTSAQGMSQIEGILANTGKFFTSLGPMVRDGTSAFLTLGKAASDEFGQLAGVLNGFAGEFRAMVERITSDGSFKAGITGLSQVVSSLLSALVKVFEAGVRVMAQIGGPLAALIDSIGNALVALMPVLGTITVLFATVLTQALDSIIPIVNALLPSFQMLASIIGQLLVGALQALEPILTAAAQILNDVLLVALKAIQPAIEPLVGFLVEFGTIVGQFLVDAFKMLQPLIADLAEFFTQLIVALTPLLPSLLQLARVIFAALLDVLSKILPPLIKLAQVVLPILIDIVEIAVPVIVSLVRILGEIIEPLANIVGFIIDAVMPSFTALMDLIQAVWPSIEGIIRGVLNVIVGLIQAVLGLITGDWSKAWDGIKLIFSGAWEAIKSSLVGAITVLIELVTGIPGAILSALGNLAGLLFDAGASIIRGLIDGIKSMFQSALNWVGSLISDIRDFFPFSPAKTGPFAGRGYTLYSGRALVADWAKGISQATPAALSAVEDLMSAADSAATAEMNGSIAAEGFGGIGGQIADALSQWEVRLDGSGLAKLVNTANIKKARRG